MVKSVELEYKAVVYPQDIQISPDSGNYDMCLMASACYLAQAHKAFSRCPSKHQ